MRPEDEFAAELAESYVRKGWEVERPEEASSFLRFLPDLLLRRGDQYLVIEIKRPGVASEPSIAAMRKIVEERPNWRLEVKLLPPGKEHASYKIAEMEIASRLALANTLIEADRYSDAFIMVWIVIEAALRRICLADEEAQRPKPMPDLFRITYEAGLISDRELRELQRGLELRNRVVHGYSIDISEVDARSFLSLARVLTERSEKTGPSPIRDRL
jgi:uncharacterized protein YutE (UPF0331/DUF86 family)